MVRMPSPIFHDSLSDAPAGHPCPDHPACLAAICRWLAVQQRCPSHPEETSCPKLAVQAAPQKHPSKQQSLLLSIPILLTLH